MRLTLALTLLLATSAFAQSSDEQWRMNTSGMYALVMNAVMEMTEK